MLALQLTSEEVKSMQEKERWNIYGLNRRSDTTFTVDALQKMNEGLLKALIEEGLVGVFVTLKDIDPTGVDNRKDHLTRLFSRHHKYNRRGSNTSFRPSSWRAIRDSPVGTNQPPCP